MLLTHYGSWSAINEELIRAKTLAIPIATTPTEVEATAFKLLFINRELKSLAQISLRCYLEVQVTLEDALPQPPSALRDLRGYRQRSVDIQ